MDHIYEVANIIAIKNGKILLVKKGDVWICPGGKLNAREKAGACAKRELRAGLPGVKLKGGLFYFQKFFGKSVSGKNIKVVCFFGILEGDISPSAEISDARWISKEDLLGSYENFLSEVTLRIIRYLIDKGAFNQ